MSLHDLLDAAARFGPEYGDGLATHLPMGLVALRALGADAPRLQAFFGTESAHLLPAPLPQDWPAGDAWAGRLGHIAAWPAYLDLLRAGGSKSPEDLGRIVGVDLADPRFWDGGLAIIDAQLSAAEQAARDAGRL